MKKLVFALSVLSSSASFAGSHQSTLQFAFDNVRVIEITTESYASIPSGEPNLEAESQRYTSQQLLNDCKNENKSFLTVSCRSKVNDLHGALSPVHITTSCVVVCK